MKNISCFAGLQCLLAAVVLSGCLTQQAPKPSLEPVNGSEEAVLTSPPMVPPPIQRNHATKVVVNLVVKEVVKTLAPNVTFNCWTFGGDVPGKFIRVREGDEVEIRLSSLSTNTMPHNIDLHAVIGQGGGAAASLTAPGHTTQFTFRAMKSGLYVYHCATAPHGMHIANGMYGLILVEPREGMPKVDHEYYIMQGEFYTTGAYGQEGLQLFSMDKAMKEQPDYVVFNGAVGAISDDKALTAKVGETVRLYVGNGGPNLISSFHVIGEIFDQVQPDGQTGGIQKNVQTTLVPPGGATIVQFEAIVPGSYLIVDHALMRALNKGTVGMLKVSGEPNTEIFSGKQLDEIYHP